MDFVKEPHPVCKRDVSSGGEDTDRLTSKLVSWTGGKRKLCSLSSTVISCLSSMVVDCVVRILSVACVTNRLRIVRCVFKFKSSNASSLREIRLSSESAQIS